MDLINTGTDPWILEHEACEILNRDILEQLALRNNHDVSSKEYDILSARIRNRLKQFTTQVEELNKKLSLASVVSSITSEEHQRRRRQIDVLQGNIVKLQNDFGRRKGFYSNSSKVNEDRHKLLGSGNEAAAFADMGTTSWVDLNSSETVSPQTVQVVKHKTVDELRQDQEKMLKSQDEGLDSLSKIISRQKHIAECINVEVNEQNELLDELSEDVGRIDGGIERERNMIRIIDRKDRTWGYWVIILILLILIIGVSFA